MENWRNQRWVCLSEACRSKSTTIGRVRKKLINYLLLRKSLHEFLVISNQTEPKGSTFRSESVLDYQKPVQILRHFAQKSYLTMLSETTKLEQTST